MYKQTEVHNGATGPAMRTKTPFAGHVERHTCRTAAASRGAWPAFILIGILLLAAPAARAGDTEQDPAARDIRLAEGVLAELLAEEAVPARSRIRSVSGRYIPGYGVHLSVEMIRAWPDSERGRRSENRRSAGEAEQEAYERIREEAAGKLTEFFTRYAHLIRDLEGDEEVRVTVRSNLPRYLFRTEERSDFARRIRFGHSETLPLLSMGVTAADLNLLRRESISEEELTGRIRREDFDRERDLTDLRVFASVLETALELVESEYLSLRGRPQFEYIPGMGVHYRIRITPGGLLATGDLQIARILPEDFGRRLGEELQGLRFADSLDVMISEEQRERIMDQIRRAGEEAARARRHVAAATDSLRARGFRFGRAAAPAEELREEIALFREQINEASARYGSTLVALADDEWLLFTIDWDLRHEELPGRTELGIRKKDLLQGVAPQEMTARSD